MTLQVLNTTQKTISTENAQGFTAAKVVSERLPLLPSWGVIGKMQKAIQPTASNLLHQALARPASLNSGDPGDNGHLSVEQVIRLANAASNPEAKEDILRTYALSRASELSVGEMAQLLKSIPTSSALHVKIFRDHMEEYKVTYESALSFEEVERSIEAQSTKFTMLNTYLRERGTKLSVGDVIALTGEVEDKKHHDKLLSLWVQLALNANELSFGGLLTMSRHAFSATTADQMLLDYVQTQNPSLSERIHLAAMAKGAETAEIILNGARDS